MLRKIIRVAAAVIVSEGRVLAAQRGYGEYEGYWEFPGGKIKEGESPREAARREIMEELEVRVSTGRYICTAEHDYPSFHLSMDCFICVIDEGEVHPNEAKSVRWLAPSEFSEVEWLPADEAVLGDVIRAL